MAPFLPGGKTTAPYLIVPLWHFTGQLPQAVFTRLFVVVVVDFTL